VSGVALGSVWVLLAYRLPREPSNPRVAVWRKLRRLGAVQMVDGLVALPADARTREQFDWLAEEIVEAGGEAWLWVGHPGSARQERTLASRMAAAVTKDYQAVFDEAVGAATMAVDGGPTRVPPVLRRGGTHPPTDLAASRPRASS